MDLPRRRSELILGVAAPGECGLEGLSGGPCQLGAGVGTAPGGGQEGSLGSREGVRIHLAWPQTSVVQKGVAEGKSKRKARRRAIERQPVDCVASLCGSRSFAGCSANLHSCLYASVGVQKELVEEPGYRGLEIDHRCAEWGRELGEETFHPSSLMRGLRRSILYALCTSLSLLPLALFNLLHTRPRRDALAGIRKLGRSPDDVAALASTRSKR